jgi:HSP20 family protein
VRSRIQAVLLPSEAGEFAEELGRFFSELGRTVTGECSPPLDVYETDDTLEVVMDLPGADLKAVGVFIKGNAMLLAGEKAPRRAGGDSSFHLVERGFGRFARAVRFTVPCDAASARATFHDGELRVTLRKMADRRGQIFRVPIDVRS